MRLRVCGTYKHSVSKLSRILTNAGIDHDLEPILANGIPFLTTKLGSLPSYYFGPVIVVDSFTRLSHSNIPILKCRSNELSKYLEDLPETEIVIKEPTSSEWVDLFSEKSFLSYVQTCLYKVSNYALRKELINALISYLYTGTGYKRLLELAKQTYQSEALLAVLKRKELKGLKSAVAEFHKDGNLEGVAKAHGISTFDISYIIKSYQKVKG